MRFLSSVLAAGLLCFSPIALPAAEAPAKPRLDNPFFAFDNGAGYDRLSRDDQAALLAELGYDGPVGLQCWGVRGDIRENLKRSITVWRRFAERMAANLQKATPVADSEIGRPSTPLAAAGENWPQFRGPDNGRSDATGLPVTWSETENIKWKTPIHGRGWSSPVVWDRQIWMTTATDDGHDQFVVCVDRDSGKILHDIKLFYNEKLQITNPLNSHASPTPVVEEGRVYVHFGAYGTACLDTGSGEVLWQRRDIYCDHFRGPGSSPILFKNLLIFPMDGIDVQYVIALEKTTGKTAWKTDRSIDMKDIEPDFRKAYSTPLLVRVGGSPQMICTGAEGSYAYDPATGEELWRVRHPGFSNVSRPLFGHGLVFVNSAIGSPTLLAVRPGGRGDVTDSHVVWKCNRGMPLKPSPVMVGELIFTVDDKGIATCLEAPTGEVVWRKRIGGKYSASPIYADGRIYFFSHEDKATVIEPARQYKELAVNKLDAGFMASPAVVGRAIYLRTKTHLYRVEQ